MGDEHMLDVQILNTEQTQMHLHGDVELIYIMEGKVSVQINDKAYELEKNDVIIVNSNNRHRIGKAKDAGSGAWWVCRMELGYRELLEDLQCDFALFWCNSAVSNSREYQVLTGILDEILGAYKVYEAGTYMKKSLYYKLVGCLAEDFLVTGMENQWSRKSRFEQEEMIQYMNANYFRPITLKEMADRLYMSETAFSKYFKKVAGMNFVQYMNNIRIHHAVEDLLYSDKPMTRIAVDNGFASPSFFNRVFRSVYNMTPTEFKESARKEKDQPEEIYTPDSREAVAGYLEGKNSRKDRQQLEKFVQTDMEAGHPLEKVWTRAINLGDAKDLLLARTQQQVRFIHKGIGFVYGQVNNLLGWDMKLRENHDVTVLNFEMADQVLDFLTEEGIIPVIDLGDHPRHTLKDFDRMIYMEERKKLYESPEEYESLLAAFMDHVIRRYGSGWVEQWMFHVWFDPGDAFENALVTQMDDYDYTQVFETTCRIVKRRCGHIRVGGAGFVLGNLHYPVRDFLACCKKLEYPPDFISLYCFPYCHVDENDILGAAIRPHTRFMSMELEHYQRLAASYGIGDIPLYIMEWNMSISQRTFYNDGCGKAALMLKNMVDNADRVWMGAYNLLSDLGADYYDSPRMLIGAAGLLTKEGIPKPCYYALEFMSRMEGQLIARGDGYMITSNRGGMYKLLMFNYKEIGQVYYLRRESELKLKDADRIYRDQLELTFHLTLENMERGPWRIHRFRVSPDYGSVLGLWEQLGQDTSTRSDVEYMRRMCTPRVEGETVLCQNGTLNLKEQLAAHEIRLIVLTR